MIPGVETVHPRSTWVAPAPPINGPAFPSWSQITLGAILHYTADDDLIDGDPGEHADQLDDYLRAIHRDYVSRRGYSIGYNWAVDWLGGVWELRGWTFRNAANVGEKYRREHQLPSLWNANHYTFSILCLVDGADPVTAEAADSISKIIGAARTATGRNLPYNPHSYVEYTACCGDGIREQIRNKAFEPRDDQEDEMGFGPRIVKPTSKYPSGPWFAVEGGSARYADADDVREANANGWKVDSPKDADGKEIHEQYRYWHRYVYGVDPT